MSKQSKSKPGKNTQYWGKSLVMYESFIPLVPSPNPPVGLIPPYGEEEPWYTKYGLPMVPTEVFRKTEIRRIDLSKKVGVYGSFNAVLKDDLNEIFSSFTPVSAHTADRGNAPPLSGIKASWSAPRKVEVEYALYDSLWESQKSFFPDVLKLLLGEKLSEARKNRVGEWLADDHLWVKSGRTYLLAVCYIVVALRSDPSQRLLLMDHYPSGRADEALFNAVGYIINRLKSDFPGVPECLKLSKSSNRFWLTSTL